MGGTIGMGGEVHEVVAAGCPGHTSDTDGEACGAGEGSA